jgi:hypothetical protein
MARKRDSIGKASAKLLGKLFRQRGPGGHSDMPPVVLHLTHCRCEEYPDSQHRALPPAVLSSRFDRLRCIYSAFEVPIGGKCRVEIE